jgi:hypothetical protein
MATQAGSGTRAERRASKMKGSASARLFGTDASPLTATVVRVLETGVGTIADDSRSASKAIHAGPSEHTCRRRLDADGALGHREIRADADPSIVARRTGAAAGNAARARGCLVAAAIRCGPPVHAATAARIQSERVFGATDLPGVVREANQCQPARKAPVAVTVEARLGARVSASWHRNGVARTTATSSDARIGDGATVGA